MATTDRNCLCSKI